MTIDPLKAAGGKKGTMSSRIRKYFEHHDSYKGEGEVKKKECPPRAPVIGHEHQIVCIENRTLKPAYGGSSVWYVFTPDSHQEKGERGFIPQCPGPAPSASSPSQKLKIVKFIQARVNASINCFACLLASLMRSAQDQALGPLKYVLDQVKSCRGTPS